MKVRKYLYAGLVFSLGAVVFSYLLLPVYSQDSRPLERSPASQDAGVHRVTFVTQQPDEPVLTVPAAPNSTAVPAFPNAAARRAGESDNVTHLQMLLKDLESRKADLRQKDALLARQQSLLDNLKKQRDDLADNVAIASKELTRMLDAYKRQLDDLDRRAEQPKRDDRARTGGDAANARLARQYPAPANDLQQKLKAIEKRLDNIERRLPPAFPVYPPAGVREKK